MTLIRVIGKRALLALAMLGASAFVHQNARAQTADAFSRQVDAFLATESRAPDLNGGVMVQVERSLALRRVYGLASFSARTPLTTSSVFQTASLAKPFTAIAILQLRDAGKLGLDQPVRDLLTWFPFTAVTVRHLLTHTSGLPDLELFEAIVGSDPDHIVGQSDLQAAFQAWPGAQLREAGANFRYSNVNYQLLAAIVERASGKTFADYVRDAIFRPAGMKASYVLGGAAIGVTRAPITNHVRATMFETMPRDVLSVRYLDERRMRRLRYETFNLGATLGDQNLFTTLGDLQRFNVALTQRRLLSEQSLAEAWRPAMLNNGEAITETRPNPAYGVRCSYGLGWEVCDHPRYGRIVGHGGFNRGIATQFLRVLNRDVALALFDNGDSSDFSLKVGGVLAIANGDAPPQMDRRRSISRAYGEELLRSGPTSARALFMRLRDMPDRWTFSGAGLNQLGYDLLFNGHKEVSLEPFRLNVELNPENGDYYDSLGEAFAALGRQDEAIAAYSRALKLNPSNENARNVLANLHARKVTGAER
jgi:CubicO group peptidase (beta-lactamase class C family)